MTTLARLWMLMGLCGWPGGWLAAQSYVSPPFNFDRRADRVYTDSLIRVTKRQMQHFSAFSPSLRLDTVQLELLHFLAYAYRSSQFHRDSAGRVTDRLMLLARQKKNVKYQIKGLLLKEHLVRAYENKYPEAIQLNFQLLKLIESEPKLFVGYPWRIYRNLGKVYQKIDYLTDALTNLSQSLVHTARDPVFDRIHAADIHQSIGAIYKQQQQYNKAEEHYQRAMTIVNEVSGNISNRAYLLNDLGQLYHAQKRFAKAAETLQQSVDLWERIKSRHPQSDALADLAETNLELGQYDDAIRHAKLALDYNKVVYPTMLTASSVLARAYEARQDWQNAYYYQRVFDQKKAEEQALVNQSTTMRLKAIFEKERLEMAFAQEQALREQQFRIDRDQMELERLRIQNRSDKLLEATRSQTLRHELETTALNATATKRQSEQQRLINRLKITQLRAGLASQQQRQQLLFWGLLTISLLSVLLLLYSIQVRRKNRELATKNRDIETALLRGQTQERRRVAADLHDNLGGMMAAIRLSIETMDSSGFSSKEQAVYQNVLTMTHQAYNDLRLLAHNLQPEALEKYGLAGALQRLITKLNDSQPIRFSLLTNGIGRLAAELETAFYPICLELANNIVKHSGATEASFEFMTRDNRFQLLVIDNGRGFDPDRTGDGMGMRTIRERTQQLGGAVSIHAHPGEGTLVRFAIPLNQPVHV